MNHMISLKEMYKNRTFYIEIKTQFHLLLFCKIDTFHLFKPFYFSS